MEQLILFGMLAITLLMVASRRMTSLIGNFRIQSAFLCLLTLLEAVKGGNPALYIVALLIFTVKVAAIPFFLTRIVKRINAGEAVGSFLNYQLSLVATALLIYFSWVFAGRLFAGGTLAVPATVAFATVLTGIFIMVLRISALAQVVGLLVMENGLFLLAAYVSGGMPLLVELAVALDVLVSVLILGMFIYRINYLFTDIDVSRLNRLKG